jgi:hypothetical protein
LSVLLDADARTAGGRTGGFEVGAVDWAAVSAGAVLGVGFEEWPEQPNRPAAVMVAATTITPRRTKIIS